jgi:hypothetical protein
MIDTTAIIFSLGMVIFVIYRASLLDRRLPWFGTDRGNVRNRPPTRR